MSRRRMWWHKVSHDRILRDPYVSALPYEALGLLTHLQCLIGSTTRGYETGILHSEDGHRISVRELLFLLSRGDDAREVSIRKSLQLLIDARQVKCNKPDLDDDGNLKLLHWASDQELAHSGDVDRKRAAAEDARRAEADEVGKHLERWFGRLKRAVSDEELLSFIKARRGGRPQQRTCESILEIWFEQGVLLRDADGLSTLASLACPPLETGADGSAGDGTGREIFPDGKIPVEEELELDPDEEGILPNPQLNPTGRGAPLAHGRGGGQASEASGRSAGSPLPVGQRPDSPAPMLSQSEADSIAEMMFEPADAFRVKDALKSAEKLLSELPGWNFQHDPPHNPASTYVLRGRFKTLRKDHGPKLADEIWRTILRGMIQDKLEGHSWTKWIGIFMKRLNDLSEAEVSR